MEWFILHRWRESAPNTPDWVAFIRMLKEICKPDPELKAMMAKLKADRKRIDAEIAGYKSDLDGLRSKIREIDRKLKDDRTK